LDGTTATKFKKYQPDASDPRRRETNDRLLADDFDRRENINRAQQLAKAKRGSLNQAELRLAAKCDRSETRAEQKTVSGKNFDRGWNANRFQ
jgi:hypothetical protein